MNTQTTTKTSGFKAGLKTLLAVGGALLIPFYAVYFSDGMEDKKELLKSSKPVVNQKIEAAKIKSGITPEIKNVNAIIAESKIKNEVPALPKIENPDNKSFDEVYKFYRDTHGEGTIFTWKGYEYLVDTLVEVIPASKYDAFDEFSKAFAEARNDLGPCSTFNYRGNKYLTCMLGETVEPVALVNKDENKGKVTKVEKSGVEQVLANK